MAKVSQTSGTKCSGEVDANLITWLNWEETFFGTEPKWCGAQEETPEFGYRIRVASHMNQQNKDNEAIMNSEAAEIAGVVNDKAGKSSELSSAVILRGSSL